MEKMPKEESNEIDTKKTENNNNNTDNNYNIKLKELKLKLKYHNDIIWCSILLKDGRIATGSEDNSIIIFNNKTFKPDLIIKEHDWPVRCLIQLKSGILASCSVDNIIKLYNIKEKEYQVIQTLNYHTKSVYKLIELNNNKLVSCSGDGNIIFYIKENNEYIKDYQFKTNGLNYCLIQTKENKICFSEYKDDDDDEEYSICFFDLIERKIITRINNIDCCLSFKMISKDLLMITGENKISIANINSNNIIRKIDIPNSSYIYDVCMLNENQLLTCDYNKNIIQWKIEGDNLILISKKENAHDKYIITLLKIGDGNVLSGDGDGYIKIWYYSKENIIGH